MDAVNITDKLLNSLHYTVGFTPPPENILFKISGETIGSEGNFIVLSGLPKSGKSLFTMAALASANSNKTIFGLSLNTLPNRPMIGYFDTESGVSDFYKNLDSIRRFGLNELSSNLNAFRTRTESAANNRVLIEHYIKYYPSSIIVIDGLLDIISNFNDEKESRFIIEWLKRITSEYNVLIIGVIHTGKKDGFTLGHYGSMLDRYAQSVLEVTKDFEFKLFRLSHKHLRSSAGFDDICIQYTMNGVQECHAPPPKKEGRR